MGQAACRLLAKTVPSRERCAHAIQGTLAVANTKADPPHTPHAARLHVQTEQSPVQIALATLDITGEATGLVDRHIPRAAKLHVQTEQSPVQIALATMDTTEEATGLVDRHIRHATKPRATTVLLAELHARAILGTVAVEIGLVKAHQHTPHAR